MESCLKTYLIFVDDEEDILTLFRHGFKKEVEKKIINILTCEDGNVAIAEIEKIYNLGHQVNIVLVSDINMPKISGVELIKEVSELFPSVYCYFCSANKEEHYRSVMEEFKVRHYFKKPCKVVEIKKFLSEDLKKVGISLEF